MLCVHVVKYKYLTQTYLSLRLFDGRIKCNGSFEFEYLFLMGLVEC